MSLERLFNIKEDLDRQIAFLAGLHRGDLFLLDETSMWAVKKMDGTSDYSIGGSGHFSSHYWTVATFRILSTDNYSTSGWVDLSYTDSERIRRIHDYELPCFIGSVVIDEFTAMLRGFESGESGT